MEIEQLKVTSKNIMEILTDKSVYVIKQTFDDEFRMYPIRETDVKTVLSDSVKIIRIAND